MKIAAPIDIYTERRATFAEQQAHYQQLSNLNGNINVALVVGLVAFLIIALWQGPLWLLAAFLFFVAFAISYANHSRVDGMRQRYTDLVAYCDEGLSRLARDWRKLPSRQIRTTEPPEPLVDDLDIVGSASLSHLLNTPRTPGGQSLLRHWLLHPASQQVVRERQEAVKELVAARDFREALAVDAQRVNSDLAAYISLLHWAESPLWLRPQQRLVMATRVLTVVTLLLILLQVVGLVGPLWLLAVAVNIGVNWGYGREVPNILLGVAEQVDGFRAYSRLFTLISDAQFTSPLLREMQDRLTAGGLRADQQMQRLGTIASFATMLRSLLFLPIQLVALYSFHVLWVLEGWQQISGRQARNWLDALSEIEALSALATLAHDHPAWAYPEMTNDTHNVFVASNLAHPLLPPERAVGNDVSIGSAGTFLLVTGSNMSGKSTLLRSIGVNIVLAQAGGPVCASSLRLAPVTLATSIRVRDSLEQGISYFMAELKRLKDIVDIARATRDDHTTTLLFLLDEILHGTNTTERQIAARQIIGFLLEAGATGAVSTHDLSLADAPEFVTQAQRVHFTETFERHKDGTLSMTFDYQLHPGLATSTNALKLMEMAGLPLADAYKAAL
jgi:energy-coupling factor transporter ATP-binding protein EcfA2